MPTESSAQSLLHIGHIGLQPPKPGDTVHWSATSAKLQAVPDMCLCVMDMSL